jgi:restriction system protein
MTVWVVRAGEELRFLPWFDSEDVVGIGWSELPESPLRMTRQELASLMRATYLDAAAGTTANYTGQVWNFINTIALGDLVVVPLKASKTFRIGRIAGPAERREKLAELTAVRPVEWEAKEVPAETLAKDLRNALGSIMTVFRPRARAAERRIETVSTKAMIRGLTVAGRTGQGRGYFRPTRSGLTCCKPWTRGAPRHGRLISTARTSSLGTGYGSGSPDPRQASTPSEE